MHNEELHYLYFLPNIVVSNYIKTKKKWMGKAWNIHGTDVKCNLEGMRLFGRQRYR
jgi:hypothetical protein